MYHYEFQKNDEKMVYENPEGLVEIGDKSYDLSVVVTNKNLLFFNNANKFNALISRGVQIGAEYYLELTIPLKNLNYSIEDGNTFLNYQSVDIIIYNFELNKVID